MNRTKIISGFFLLFITFFTSCKQENSNTRLEFSHISHIYLKTDEILSKFRIGNKHYNAKYSGNELSILINDSTIHTISLASLPEFYNLSNTNFIRFHFHNFCINERMDSLWVSQYDTLYLLQPQENLLKKWNLSVINGLPDGLFAALIPHRYPLLHQNKLLLSIFSHNSHPKEPIDAWIEINDGELHFKGFAAFVPFEAPKGTLYPLENISRVALNDSLIYSFGQSSFLYIYKNGILSDSIYAPSKYIKSFTPFPEKDLNNSQALRKYEIESGYFDYFFFNPYQNSFFRKCIHPSDFINSEGKITQEREKNWSLQVFDRKLNLKKEIFFNGKDYSKVFFTKEEELYFLKKNNSITFDTINELKKISYEVYKLAD